jgi:predicted nucleic acid-binding protein
MTRGPAVIDTNVVVAGLLTRTPSSPPARILDGMLSGRFRYFLSADLLAEYREVLLRPKIQRRHQLSPAEVDVLLTDLAANAIWIEASPGASRKDDQHLHELIARKPEALLATGDLKLAEHRGTALTPRAFVELLDE